MQRKLEYLIFLRLGELRYTSFLNFNMSEYVSVFIGFDLIFLYIFVFCLF